MNPPKLSAYEEMCAKRCNYVSREELTDNNTDHIKQYINMSYAFAT